MPEKILLRHCPRRADDCSARGSLPLQWQKILSKNGTARYLDGTLIGATISRNHIVKRFRDFTGCSLAEAIHTAILNPAKLLGLENRKGCLRIGADADVILLDENFDVQFTIVAGKIAYQKSLT